MSAAIAPKLGGRGQLVPVRGFSRRRTPPSLPSTFSAWCSHDGLDVISSLGQSHLPGSGEPPLVGPQWLVSVSRSTGGLEARCRVTDDDLHRVIECFAMPAYDEDNHHPGIARHLWCPVDPAYQQACECKLTEVAVTEPSGYRWTTEQTSCRGCQYQQLTGLLCTMHARPRGVR